MIVAIYDTDNEYAICLPEEFVCSQYKIDVTQKFWDRYLAYEAEREFIQSKLHRYYTDAKNKEILDRSNSKEAIQPHGF